MTDPYSRREVMGLVAGGMAGGLGLRDLHAAFATPPDADLVVFNAKVYTMNAASPRAEAFAIKAGRFVAVGSNNDIKPLITRRTQSVDAKQMTIVPGFIDCHNHAGGEVLLYEVLVGNPFEVEFVTIASIIDKLRAKAHQTPPGTWVEGYFFDDTKVSDKRELNVHDLDEVSVQHPVVVLHRVSYEAGGRVLDSMLASGIQTGFGDEWIKFGATSEHTVDGSFSERTMALSQPYPGDKSGYKGNVTETQEELNAWIETVHRAGIQVNSHANG